MTGRPSDPEAAAAVQDPQSSSGQRRSGRNQKNKRKNNTRESTAKSKKRRKRSAEQASSSGGKPPHLAKTESKAEDRPAFSRTYPADERIDALLAAFMVGNYARVRLDSPALIASDDAGVSAAARDLRRRIQTEPSAAFLWAIGILLVVFLYGYYLSGR